MIAWGEEFGRSLQLPAFVALIGDLGAGKTTLVRAIARSQGTLEPVTSPTYGLVHEYTSPRGEIYHLDLYRLESREQLHQIGWQEILSGDGLVLVEWPDRAGESLPDEHFEIRLQHIAGDATRRRVHW